MEHHRESERTVRSDFSFCRAGAASRVITNTAASSSRMQPKPAKTLFPKALRRSRIRIRSSCCGVKVNTPVDKSSLIVYNGREESRMPRSLNKPPKSPARFLRERAGISRQDAAKQVGVSHDYLRQIEKGIPSYRMARRLARLYGCSLDSFL